MRRHGIQAQAILFLLLLSLAAFQVLADPSGAAISNNVTGSRATPSPAMRNDSRGTITTMVLNSIQQDSYWKAYVGNVSGSLRLDNPNNFTIYSWDLTTITGQVYASRFGNLTWSSVSCAPAGLIGSEENFHNMTVTVDNISRTFNYTVHKTFQVASTTVANSTCRSTTTWVNGTRQTLSEGSPYQEILLQDANSQLLYLTDISDNAQGYDNQSYDFQMIVAESDRKATPTPYYFYVELR